jgi:hypothetical protein
MMKTFKIISGDHEYLENLSRSIELLHAAPGTDEHAEREFLIVLIRDYEYRMGYQGVME